MTGVYGIVCLANRKLYIGQSVNIQSRFSNHKYKLRKQIHINPGLQKAWNKYGQQFFKLIIVEETSKKQLFKREAWWIDTLKTFNPSIGFNRNRYDNDKDN